MSPAEDISLRRAFADLGPKKTRLGRRRPVAAEFSILLAVDRQTLRMPVGLARTVDTLLRPPSETSSRPKDTSHPTPYRATASSSRRLWPKRVETGPGMRGGFGFPRSLARAKSLPVRPPESRRPTTEPATKEVLPARLKTDPRRVPRAISIRFRSDPSRRSRPMIAIRVPRSCKLDPLRMFGIASTFLERTCEVREFAGGVGRTERKLEKNCRTCKFCNCSIRSRA